MKGQGGRRNNKTIKKPVVKFPTSSSVTRFRASLGEDHWVVCQTGSREKCSKGNLDNNHNHILCWKQRWCFQILPFFGCLTWPPRPRSMAELPRGYRPLPKLIFSFWEIQIQNFEIHWTTKKTPTKYVQVHLTCNRGRWVTVKSGEGNTRAIVLSVAKGTNTSLIKI